jgi:hypothetical protein
MKKIQVTLSFLIFVSIAFSQSLQDSKDFISEKISASNPLSNYDNNVFFSENILRQDAENLVNKNLSDIEFEYIFIYMRDVYLDGTQNKLAWTVAECVDIRGIDKVSVTRVMGEQPFCNVTVYMDEGFLSRNYSRVSGQEAEHGNIPKMQILISDNLSVANSIKRAIIKMGEHCNVAIRDADKF